MEAASFAFGLVAVFKDAYLTTKFIRDTVRTLKEYESEQQEIATHFTVQIWVLRNFSRLFCVANSNKVDFELLEGVSEDYLQTIRDVLTQHQRVLAEYSKGAAYLDADYQRFLDLSRRSQIEAVREAWLIEDEIAPESPQHGPMSLVRRLTGPERDPRSWFMRAIGGSRSGKSGTVNSSRSKTAASVKSVTLPPNVRWLFRKSELRRTLDSLRRWNGDLKDLIGPLLDAFGFFRNVELQKRLKSDGSENIFQGHLALNTLAENKHHGGDAGEDCFVPLEDAHKRMKGETILAEFKQVAAALTSDSDPEALSIVNDLRPVKELYGPQLARLLRTAGTHSFRTLPLNCYSWDVEKSRYIYLFDYPQAASRRQPMSLADVIQASNSRHKLELKQRFYVAQSMARAIGAFHSDGWLHKNIRAHAVKFFFPTDNDDRFDSAHPYLTDFEFSRPVSGVTRLLPQAVDIEHEVYRHPDRHGMPGIGFNKMHDIYSLGVVLLEIALWQTAQQQYDDAMKYGLKGVTAPGELTAQKIKEVFLHDAQERIAHRMGSAYQEAVVACLDEDWDAYVDSRELAKEFYDKVIQKVDIRAFLA